ncbi:hypothetical protein ACN42_g1179 [Penicillium freii]|uniref:Uncharacterized protein n=1 Tax=Penicillium freii TaxID=48697 RepID=A0A101MSL0_PENFR|nr:hypothetical protein ACN42_g1179 [Penicillium freii]
MEGCGYGPPSQASISHNRHCPVLHGYLPYWIQHNYDYLHNDCLPRGYRYSGRSPIRLRHNDSINSRRLDNHSTVCTHCAPTSTTITLTR